MKICSMVIHLLFRSSVNNDFSALNIDEEAQLGPKLFLVHISTKLNTATEKHDFLHCVFKTTILVPLKSIGIRQTKLFGLSLMPSNLQPVYSGLTQYLSDCGWKGQKNKSWLMPWIAWVHLPVWTPCQHSVWNVLSLQDTQQENLLGRTQYLSCTPLHLAIHNADILCLPTSRI